MTNTITLTLPADLAARLSALPAEDVNAYAVAALSELADEHDGTGESTLSPSSSPGSETLAASVGGDELSEDDLAAIGRGLAALDAGQVTPGPVAFAQLRAHLDELKRARRNHGEEVAV